MNKADLVKLLEKVPDETEIAMEIICGEDCPGNSFGWANYVSQVKDLYNGRKYVVLKEDIG